MESTVKTHYEPDGSHIKHFDGQEWTTKGVYSHCEKCRQPVYAREDKKIFCLNENCNRSPVFAKEKKGKIHPTISLAYTSGLGFTVFSGILKSIAALMIFIGLGSFSIANYHSGSYVWMVVLGFFSLVSLLALFFIAKDNVFGNVSDLASIEFSSRESTLSDWDEYEKRQKEREESEGRVVAHALKHGSINSSYSENTKRRIRREVKAAKKIIRDREEFQNSRLLKQSAEFQRIRQRHKNKFTSKLLSMSTNC